MPLTNYQGPSCSSFLEATPSAGASFLSRLLAACIYRQIATRERVNSRLERPQGRFALHNTAIIAESYAL
jgi:hypothetical protein